MIFEAFAIFLKSIVALVGTLLMFPIAVCEGLVRAVAITWNADTVHEIEPPVNVAFDLIMMMWLVQYECCFLLI